MPLLSLGGLSVHSHGRDDAPGSVLLCHGYGAPGEDLVPLAEALDPRGRFRWFFPAAPLDLAHLGLLGGRAWWPIDMVRLQMAVMSNDIQSLLEQTPQGLAEARSALEACIDELCQKHGVVRERLVIGGFSQGAMLATEVALNASTPFAGLAVLSGTLISRPRWEEALSKHGSQLQVLQSHGRADPILPFAAAERLRDLFTQNGAHVEWVAHRGGHELPEEVLLRLLAFLQSRLAKT
jgi:phospholipase/carboxylesterase